MEDALASTVTFVVCCCLPATLLGAVVVGLRARSKRRRKDTPRISKLPPPPGVDLSQYPFIVPSLEEFGKQKWGAAEFGIYRMRDSVRGTCVWIVPANRREFAGINRTYGRKGVREENLYKHAGYEVTLNTFGEEPFIAIGYGGYSEYFSDGEDIRGGPYSEKDVILERISELAFRQILAEILSKGYEPKAVLSHLLAPHLFGRIF